MLLVALPPRPWYVSWPRQVPKADDAKSSLSLHTYWNYDRKVCGWSKKACKGLGVFRPASNPGFGLGLIGDIDF